MKLTIFSELSKALGRVVDHQVCRPYTDFKSTTTYLYVSVNALTEDAARLLTAETGFVFHRKPHAEI